MNKNEFVAAVSDHKILAELAPSKSLVGAVVDAALAAITEALSKGEEVRLVGFGNFYVTHREAGMSRNPRTGEAVAVKASRQPKFRAGKQLKDEVNKEKA